MTKKIFAAGLVALTIAVSALSSSAQAKPWHHHHHHGHHIAGAAAAGLLGVLAIGALAANSGGECYIDKQPVTDRWGNLLYFREARVCE
jgi:hypothetical protein